MQYWTSINQDNDRDNDNVTEVAHVNIARTNNCRIIMKCPDLCQSRDQEMSTWLGLPWGLTQHCTSAECCHPLFQTESENVNKMLDSCLIHILSDILTVCVRMWGGPISKILAGSVVTMSKPSVIAWHKYWPSLRSDSEVTVSCWEDPTTWNKEHH